MYLTELCPKSGLVRIDKEESGILAIREFREILHDETLRMNKEAEFPGIECFTAIALTADYKSPYRQYNETDRPRAAQEEVTGKRDAFEWDTEKIQSALIKYDELQYDPTIEEGKIHFQRKVTALEELKESEKYYGRNHGLKDSSGEDRIFENPERISTRLRKINEDIKKHQEQIQGKDIFDEAPTKNGYKLSRLEQKVLKKRSFYKEKR